MKFLRGLKRLIGMGVRFLVELGAEKWEKKPGFDPTKPPSKKPYGGRD